MGRERKTLKIAPKPKHGELSLDCLYSTLKISPNSSLDDLKKHFADNPQALTILFGTGSLTDKLFLIILLRQTP